MELVQWIPMVVVVAAAVAAGAVDFYRFRVPNAITFPLLLTGLAFHTAVGSMEGLKMSLLGAAVGFGVLFLLYLIGGMGAGDVKLLSGIGAWLGAAMALQIVLFAALAGGVYAVVLMVWHAKGRETLARLQVGFFQLVTVGRYFSRDDAVQAMVRSEEGRKRAVPFGTMLAVGVVIVLCFGSALSAMMR